MKPAIGQQVTCLFPVEAFYSDYGLNKGRTIVFSPGMVGVVKCISPKVVLPAPGRKLPNGIDRRSHSAVVDYQDESGNTQRVGLNFCNIAPATDTTTTTTAG